MGSVPPATRPRIHPVVASLVATLWFHPSKRKIMWIVWFFNFVIVDLSTTLQSNMASIKINAFILVPSNRWAVFFFFFGIYWWITATDWQSLRPRDVQRVLFIWQCAVWERTKPNESATILQFHPPIRVPQTVVWKWRNSPQITSINNTVTNIWIQKKMWYCRL